MDNLILILIELLNGIGRVRVGTQEEISHGNQHVLSLTSPRTVRIRVGVRVKVKVRFSARTPYLSIFISGHSPVF